MTTTKLSTKQRAIIPIAAFTADGDLDKLKASLENGLDAGLTVNEIKEILVQMYALRGLSQKLEWPWHIYGGHGSTQGKRHQRRNRQRSRPPADRQK